jgi:hypothetical protein
MHKWKSKSSFLHQHRSIHSGMSKVKLDPILSICQRIMAWKYSKYGTLLVNVSLLSGSFLLRRKELSDSYMFMGTLWSEAGPLKYQYIYIYIYKYLASAVIRIIGFFH